MYAPFIKTTDLNFIQALILAVVSAVLLWAGWLIKSWLDLRKQRKKNLPGFESGLNAIANVYRCMDHISRIDHVCQVFLIEVSNDGSRPKPGSKLYAKGIEVKMDYSHAPKHVEQPTREELLYKFEKLRCDEAYIQMCLEVSASSKRFEFIMEEQQGTLLWNVYKSRGIGFCEVHHLYTDSKADKMYILSVATFDKQLRFNEPEVRAIIDSSIDQIRIHFETFRCQ